jgi:hypothetical protein
LKSRTDGYIHAELRRRYDILTAEKELLNKRNARSILDSTLLQKLGLENGDFASLMTSFWSLLPTSEVATRKYTEW